MKSVLLGLALTASVEALVVRTSCCFGISVSGEGTVGQLSDGQNRLGGVSETIAQQAVSTDRS